MNKEKQIIEEIEKHYELKSDVKKIILFSSIILGIIAILLSSFIILYFRSSEKTIGIGGDIESVMLSEDLSMVFIKIGGESDQEIVGVKFNFKVGNKSYIYETSEGIQEISVPLERGFWDWLFGKSLDGIYDYEISASDVGLESFDELEKVDFSFEYKDKETEEIKETGVLDTANPASVVSTGPSDGPSSNGPGPETSATCSDGLSNQGEIGVDCGGPCGACVVAQYTNNITQYNITWYFDKDYEYGTFANGDFWVVPENVGGNVTIIDISPRSYNDSFGDIRHGSMINPQPLYRTSSNQGFDNRLNMWDESENVALPNGQNISILNPLEIPSNSSLISTKSRYEPWVWSAKDMQILTASVLTVLDSAPASGSFRPAYVGNDKTINYNISDLNYSKLGNHSLVGSGLPELFEDSRGADDVDLEVHDFVYSLEREFQRVWLDWQYGNHGSYMHPQYNAPFEGNDIAEEVGEAALFLNSNYSNLEKKKLLIRFVQLGIDNYGVIINNGTVIWHADGQIGPGRKFPILFAGYVLNDNEMSNIGNKSGDYVDNGTSDADNPPLDYIYFAEDDQTFYVEETSPGVYNWGARNYSSKDIGLPEWGRGHVDNPLPGGYDNLLWDAAYRLGNGRNFGGFVLSAHMMGMKNYWNHNALFDYVDRFMEVQDTPQSPVWVKTMWDFYRPQFGCVWTRNNQSYCDSNFGSLDVNNLNSSCYSQGHYNCDNTLEEYQMQSPYCGDGNCSVGEDVVDTVGYCEWDCGGAQPSSCQLTNATWSQTSVVNGTVVDLIVEGSNCDGEEINFIIMEYDWTILPDDTVNLIINTYGSTTTWTSLWTYIADQYSPGYPEQDDDDLFNDPRDYYFIATLVNNISESIDSFNEMGNPLLEVSEVGGAAQTEYYVSPTGTGDLSGNDASNTMNLADTETYANNNLNSAIIFNLMNFDGVDLIIDNGWSERTSWDYNITFRPAVGENFELNLLAVSGDQNKYMEFNGLVINRTVQNGAPFEIFDASHVRAVDCNVTGYWLEPAGTLTISPIVVNIRSLIAGHQQRDILIEGCDIQNGVFGIDIGGGSLNDFREDIIFRNNEIHHLIGPGITTHNTGTDIMLIEGNHIYDGFRGWDGPPGGAQTHGSGIAIWDSGDIIVRGNKIHDLGSTTPIQTYIGGNAYENIVIENNLVYDSLNAPHTVLLENIGTNITIRNNTFVGHKWSSAYMGIERKRYENALQLRLANGYDGTGIIMHDNVFAGTVNMQVGMENTVTESDNIIWSVNRGNSFYQTLTTGSNSLVIVIDNNDNTASGYNLNYFENAENFFSGEPDTGLFNTYSYEFNYPLNTTHKQHLDNAYVPMNGSDACLNGIITKGHMAGQACAVGGAQPLSDNNLSQFGITWFFDKPVTNDSGDANGKYLYGTFANGDFWVLGPVNITKITPETHITQAGEVDFYGQVYDEGTIVHGSMINPSGISNQQGYTTGGATSSGSYNNSLNVAWGINPINPLFVLGNSSLISMKNRKDTGSGARTSSQTAAILTILDSALDQNDYYFRPTYVGTNKSIQFNVSDLDYSKLKNLTALTSVLTLHKDDLDDPTDQIETIERMFERPWIDHFSDHLGRTHHPLENMPDYGSVMAEQIGEGALMLNLNFSNTQKETLLISYVQLGLDLYGVIQDGGNDTYHANGGHPRGRKMPIFLASLVLNDQDMQDMFEKTGDYLYEVDGYGPGNPPPGLIRFAEDDETFYVDDVDIFDVPYDLNVWGGGNSLGTVNVTFESDQVYGQGTGWSSDEGNYFAVEGGAAAILGYDSYQYAVIDIDVWLQTITLDEPFVGNSANNVNYEINNRMHFGHGHGGNHKDYEEYTVEHLGLPEFGYGHATYLDEAGLSWNAKYRSGPFTGRSALAVLIMGEKDLWNHDAWFDYEDRFIGFSKKVGGAWFDTEFARDMWDEYREDYGCIWVSNTLDACNCMEFDIINYCINVTESCYSTGHYDCSGTPVEYQMQSPYCGDGSCNIGEDIVDTFGYCEWDCGGAQPTSCQLTNATWSQTSVDEGTVVDLIVEGDNCEGEDINFTIYENDIIFDDYIESFVVDIATASWIAQWFNDGVGDPEYYFIATLVNNISESIDSSAFGEDLSVSELVVGPLDSACVPANILCVDDTPGSFQEYSTIQSAVDNVSAGQEVWVKDGTYYESVTISVSGEAGNPITIKNYPGERPIVSGAEPVTNWTQVQSDDEFLTVLEEINSNYSNIYRTRILASKLPINNPGVYDNDDVKLFEDGVNRRIAIWPNQEVDYSLNPKDFQSLDSEGESFGFRDRLIDTNNLMQDSGYWTGARLAIHLAELNHNMAYSDIIDSNNGVLNLSPNLPADISNSSTRGADVYAIFNHPHVLDRPGEFYFVEDPSDPNYYWFYLWPTDPANLDSKITMPEKDRGFFSSTRDYITIEGLTIKGYQLEGILATGSNSANPIYGITIKDCIVEDTAQTGIYLKYVVDSLVDGCNVARAGTFGIFINQGLNGTIKNSEAKDTSVTNILFFNVTNGLLMNNTVHGALGGHGSGMSAYYGSKNVLIAYNTFKGPHLSLANTENMIVFANVFDSYEATSHIVVKYDDSASRGYNIFAHNTILGSNNNQSLVLPIRMDSQPIDEIPEKYVFNNVIDGMTLWEPDKYPTMIDRTYNFYTGFQETYQKLGVANTGSNVPWGLNVGEIDGRTSTLNELFVNPGKVNSDYTLADSSELIGKGKSLSGYLSDPDSPFSHISNILGFDFTKDKAGNDWAITPSMGAYEYVGSAPVPTSCQLTNATWSQTNVDEGTVVDLIVEGNDCDGKDISFEVRELDFVFDDAVDVNPVNISFSGGTATGSWTAEYHFDGFGDPEYYFIATLVNNISESIDSSDFGVDLSVSELVVGDGETYYVDDDCDGSGTGDIGDPFCTIQEAAEIVKNGEIVYILPGTYSENNIEIENTGSLGNPITFKAYDMNNLPKLSGAVSGLNWQVHDSNIYVASVDWTPETLLQNGIPLFISQEPNQPDSYERFNRDYLINVSLENNGLSKTELIDSAFFTQQTDGYWNNSYVYIFHKDDANSFSVYDINDYIAADNKIIFDAGMYNVGSTDKYSVANHIDLIDKQGEWAYDETNNLLYVWPYDSNDLFSIEVGKHDSSFLFDTKINDYIVLDGLDVYGYQGRFGITQGKGGIHLEPNGFSAKNMIIKNSVFHDNMGDGIWARYNVDGLQILNSSFYHNYEQGITVTGGRDIRIIGNAVYENGEDGIYIGGGTVGTPGIFDVYGIILKNNKIYNNSGGKSHADNLQFSSVINATIDSNYFYKKDPSMQNIWMVYNSNFKIINNIFQNGIVGINAVNESYVYNNIFDKSTVRYNAYVEFYGGIYYPSIVEFKNNVIYGEVVDGAMIGTVGLPVDLSGFDATNNVLSMDGNNYHRGLWEDIASPANNYYEFYYDQDYLSDFTDKHFVNYPIDLHLKENSTLIDAGIDVGIGLDIEGNVRPQGSGYDIGAYEYNGSAPVPQTPQTYYVSAIGSGDGSFSNPFNLSEAMANASGMPDVELTYLLSAGSYGDFSVINTARTAWATWKANEGGVNFNTIDINNNLDAYLIFEGINVQAGTGVNGVTIINSSYIKINNSLIDGLWNANYLDIPTGWNMLSLTGVYIGGGDSSNLLNNIIIENSIIKEFISGISTSGTVYVGDNWIFRNNSIHTTAKSQMEFYRSNQNTGGTVVIDGNEIYGYYGFMYGGGDLTHGSGISVRSNNINIINNEIHATGSSGGGIFFIEGSAPAGGFDNILIEKNLIYDNINNYIVRLSGVGAGSFIVRNNTIIGSHKDLPGYAGRAYYGDPLYVLEYPGTTGSGLEIYGNIIVGTLNIGSGLTDYTEDNNYIYSFIDHTEVDATSNSNWRSSPKGANSVILTYSPTVQNTTFENNFFVNPDYSESPTRRMDLDYTLLMGSPVCSNGIITRGHLVGEVCAPAPIEELGTYYVSATGSGDGSFSNPFNLSEAMANASGMLDVELTYLLSAGNYPRFWQGKTVGEGASLIEQMTPDRTEWVTWKADDIGVNFKQIRIENDGFKGYLIFDGLNVSETISIQETSYVKIRNSLISQKPDLYFGIYSPYFGLGNGITSTQTDYVTIENNEIYNVRRGVDVGGGNYWVIRNNTIYRIGEDGIEASGASHILIEDNNIYHMRSRYSHYGTYGLKSGDFIMGENLTQEGTGAEGVAYTWTDYLRIFQTNENWLQEDPSFDIIGVDNLTDYINISGDWRTYFDKYNRFRIIGSNPSYSNDGVYNVSSLDYDAVNDVLTVYSNENIVNNTAYYGEAIPDYYRIVGQLSGANLSMIHKIDGSHRDGIQIHSTGPNNITLDGNIIHDGGQGIKINGINGITNVIVKNNLVYDLSGWSGLYYAIDNISFYNNTFIGNGSVRIGTKNGNNSLLVTNMYNNIIRGLGQQDDDGINYATIINHGNNIFGNDPNNDGGPLDPFTLNSSELVNVDINSLFKDPVAGNYSPINTMAACNGSVNNVGVAVGALECVPVCDNGETRICGSDVGECELGIESCVNNNWEGICSGEVIPVIEICGNSFDEDCDGSDEVCPPEGIPGGYVAWWGFEGNYNDSYADNHGIPVGNLGFTQGVLGSALLNDGESLVDLDNYPDLDINNNLTISAWVNTSDSSKLQVIFTKGQINGAEQYAKYHLFIENGNFRFRISNSSTYTSSNDIYVTSTTSVQNNEWYHVIGRFNTTHISIFVNGVEEDSLEVNILVLGDTIKPQTALGGDYSVDVVSGGRYHFNGSIDEVMIYDRALNDSEIGDIFNARGGLPTQNPFVEIWNWIKGLLTQETGHAILNANVVNENMSGKVERNKEISFGMIAFVGLFIASLLIIGIVSFVKIKQSKIKF